MRIHHRFAKWRKPRSSATVQTHELMYLHPVRHLPKARVNVGQQKPLLEAIVDGSAGDGSIAGEIH
jgi:hypothetical protein